MFRERGAILEMPILFVIGLKSMYGCILVQILNGGVLKFDQFHIRGESIGWHRVGGYIQSIVLAVVFGVVEELTHGQRMRAGFSGYKP